MKNDADLITLIYRVWCQIDRTNKFNLIVLFGLAFLTSFSEIISIGALLPFLGAISDPQKILDEPLLQQIFKVLNIATQFEVLLAITVIFCISVVASCTMRMILMSKQVTINNEIAIKLSVKIYQHYLHLNYSDLVSINSSEIMTTILQKSSALTGGGVYPAAVILNSIIMLTVILTGLIILNPIVAVSSILGFGIIYFLITRHTKNMLIICGSEGNKAYSSVVKNLQEGLGGIRDVLLDSLQSFYLKEFEASERKYKRSLASAQIISSTPKFIIEMLGMVLIAVIAYFLALQPSIGFGVIPLLGVLALSSQRMLPLLQQIYSSWVSITSSKASINEALTILEQKIIFDDIQKIEPILFNKSIQLNDVSFKYRGSELSILKEVDIEIVKGEKIGIIGRTGCGKSTFLDLLMGLLTPSDGSMIVDGVQLSPNNISSWKKNIAHVPQSIYLSDTSIMENIAFGLPANKIDINRAIEAAKFARIFDDIEALPVKFETKVGERGVRLSGGQRQRIGLARAFYKNAPVVILDEATSALDSDTELAVMEAFDGLASNTTILIVAHRLSSLYSCHRILMIENNGIRELGSYDDVIKSRITL